MSNEERSLGDTTIDRLTPDDVLTVDSSVQPTPEDFDMDAWLAGVRPTRRSIKLYPQAHLIARLEEIAVQIDETPDGVNVDDLVEEFERVKAEFRDGVWFTLEKRSSEWETSFRKDLCKRLKLDPDKKESDLAIVITHQLVEQIVVPSGVTYRQLRKLRDTNEGEFNKLAMVMTAVNQSLAEKAGVLDRDFSGRRSDTNQD